MSDMERWAQQAADRITEDGWGEPAPPACICIPFGDTGGFRIADLCCPIHGVNGVAPGDGYWDDDDA